MKLDHNLRYDRYKCELCRWLRHRHQVYEVPTHHILHQEMRKHLRKAHNKETRC